MCIKICHLKLPIKYHIPNVYDDIGNCALKYSNNCITSGAEITEFLYRSDVILLYSVLVSVRRALECVLIGVLWCAVVLCGGY